MGDHALSRTYTEGARVFDPPVVEPLPDAGEAIRVEPHELYVPVRASVESVHRATGRGLWGTD